MRDIFLYSLLCVLFLVDAVLESDSLIFVLAIFSGIAALRSAYRSGKGQMLTESELPEGTYHVVHEVCRNGHTFVAVLTARQKLLVCVSDGLYFTKFKLWGDPHRVLTPIGKKAHKTA